MFIATQFGSADALPLGAHEIAGKTTFDLEHGNRKYQSNWLMCVSLSFLFFFCRQGCKIPRQPDIESLMNCPGIYRTRNLLHSTISDCCIPLREVLWTNQYKWMGSPWYFLLSDVSMFALTSEKSWILQIYPLNRWNHLCYTYIYIYIDVYIHVFVYTHCDCLWTT